MATTLEDLEKRLVAVETELARLRQRVEAPGPPATLDSGLRWRPRDAADQAVIDAAWNKVMGEMGIHAEPVGPERLREMMLADGVNPEDNSGSREIIAMREE